MTSDRQGEVFTVVFFLLFLTCLVVLVSRSLYPVVIHSTTIGAEAASTVERASAEAPPVPIAESFSSTPASMRRTEWLDLTLALVSIGLVLLTIVVALVGIWGGRLVESMVRREVERQFEPSQKRLDDHLNEVQVQHERVQGLVEVAEASSKAVREVLTARLFNTIALIFGRLSRAEGNFVTPNRDDLLARALYFAGKSLEMFDDLNEQDVAPEIREQRLRAVNNLVFYRALEGDPSQAGGTLVMAEELRRYGLDDIRARAYFLLTWIRAIGQFRSQDLAQLERAKEVLTTIEKRGALNPEMREELKQYKVWIRGKVVECKKATNR